MRTMGENTDQQVPKERPTGRIHSDIKGRKEEKLQTGRNEK